MLSPLALSSFPLRFAYSPTTVGCAAARRTTWRGPLRWRCLPSARVRCGGPKVVVGALQVFASFSSPVPSSMFPGSASAPSISYSDNALGTPFAPFLFCSRALPLALCSLFQQNKQSTQRVSLPQKNCLDLDHDSLPHLVHQFLRSSSL